MIELLQETVDIYVPSLPSFEQWSLLVAPIEQHDLIIKIVTEAESAHLNKQFRQKDNPTNILSFAAETIPGFQSNELGSLAMCGAIINHEAAELDIHPEKHWAHLTIHGCLHLLGYDHQTEQQAVIMEQHEISALDKLGFPNPYEHSND